MPILDALQDPEKIHSFLYNGTTIKVKPASMAATLEFLRDNCSPDASREQRRDATAGYIAQEVLVDWDDPDIPFDVEVIASLLRQPEFKALRDRIDAESSADENFKMGRDAALKKFSATISPPSGSGAKTA